MRDAARRSRRQHLVGDTHIFLKLHPAPVLGELRVTALNGERGVVIFAVGREEKLYCTGDWVTLDENGDVLLYTQETIGRNFSESFAFTAIDRLATGGISIGGRSWRRAAARPEVVARLVYLPSLSPSSASRL